MDSLLGIVKSLVGALLMPLPVFLGLTLLGLALLAVGRRRLGWGLTLAALLSLALAAWRPVAEIEVHRGAASTVYVQRVGDI